jgi:hypothetical protein
MGVKVDKILERVSATTSPADWAKPAPIRSGGPASWGYAIDARANDAFTAVNRLLKAGVAISRARTAIGDWPPGAFVVRAGEDSIDDAVRDLGVRLQALAQEPSDLVPLRAPRIGIYHGWGGNIDEGWTRWLLEQFEFPYTSIYDADVRAGGLRSKLDVIVLPEASLSQMVMGLDEGTMPKEYTGGITPRGLLHFYEFTSEGGTLVAMDAASELPIEIFGVHVRNVTADQPESKFFIPGTILKIQVDNDHPLAWGMPEEAAAFFAHSPAFDVGRPPTRFEEQRGIDPGIPEGYHVVASYPKEKLLMSGWLMGEEVLSEKAAVVVAPVGSGRAVLLGFRVQHRGQSHQTYKLLFNSFFLPS